MAGYALRANPPYDHKPLIRLTASPSAAALTGKEQRSPTQTKAAPSGAAAILSRAGCAAGSASALGARSTMRVRIGSLSAAAVSAAACAPQPVTTISVA